MSTAANLREGDRVVINDSRSDWNLMPGVVVQRFDSDADFDDDFDLLELP